MRASAFVRGLQAISASALVVTAVVAAANLSATTTDCPARTVLLLAGIG